MVVRSVLDSVTMPTPYCSWRIVCPSTRIFTYPPSEKANQIDHSVELQLRDGSARTNRPQDEIVHSGALLDPQGQTRARDSSPPEYEPVLDWQLDAKRCA